MPITTEERDQVVSELKRFGQDLNLNDQQREKLQSSLVEAREKLAEYLKKNPNTTRAEIATKVKAHRDEIRQRVANFLSPEQLTKWNAEMAKAKEFLGQKLDA
jgi:protein CpxP